MDSNPMFTMFSRVIFQVVVIDILTDEYNSFFKIKKSERYKKS